MPEISRALNGGASKQVVERIIRAHFAHLGTHRGKPVTHLESEEIWVWQTGKPFEVTELRTKDRDAAPGKVDLLTQILHRALRGRPLAHAFHRPELLCADGRFAVESIEPVAPIVRAGGADWIWPQSYFRTQMARLTDAGVFSEAERDEFEVAWEAFGEVGETRVVHVEIGYKSLMPAEVMSTMGKGLGA